MWASSNEYIFCHHEHSWHGESHVQSSFTVSGKMGEARQMVTANVLSAAVTAVRSANLVNAEEADRDDDDAQ